MLQKIFLYMGDNSRARTFKFIGEICAITGKNQTEEYEDVSTFLFLSCLSKLILRMAKKVFLNYTLDEKVNTEEILPCQILVKQDKNLILFRFKAFIIDIFRPSGNSGANPLIILVPKSEVEIFKFSQRSQQYTEIRRSLKT